MSELKVNQISKRNGNNISLSDPLKLKSYTTSQRDALTSANGDMIYNSTENKPQIFQAGAWKNAGGIDPFSVEYLVIAGGGGGNNSGAGAGGYRSNVSGESSGGGASAETSMTLAGGVNYTITVGAGGAGGVDGSDSQFQGVVSYGGGKGASTFSEGHIGGSGSGGGHVGGGGTRDGMFGVPNQGFKGGQKTGDAGPFVGAGGGGAGGNGANGTGSGSSGGAGVDSSITGASVGRAGGGSTNTVATIDGGGNGSNNGTANTGGGGGNGRSGGSGVVILRFATASATVSVGAGLTHTSATDGSDTVLSFTAGTGTISFS